MKRSVKPQLIIFALILFASAATLAQAEQVTPPDAKYETFQEMRQGLPVPRLRVEAFHLTCLYNRLRGTGYFSWYCKTFGEVSIRKLRSFFKVMEDKVSPTFIEIHLDTGILFYRPVGAVGSDLTKSEEWAGKDLEGAANALKYTKDHSTAIVNAQKRYYANAATWPQTLTFLRELEQSGLPTTTEEWSIRGLLFSPKSEPETQLANLEKNDSALANYGKRIQAACSSSRTLSGRIIDLPNPMQMIVDSDTGLRVSYHAFETTVDVDRKPVNAQALLTVADKSKKGVLADVRFVEQEGQRIVLTCQLRGVTAPLINEMASLDWDGTDTMALEILQRVETETGRSAVTRPQKRVVKSIKGVTTPDRRAKEWMERSLGLRF